MSNTESAAMRILRFAGRGLAMMNLNISSNIRGEPF
jgi:hypothetical protein